MADKKPKVYLGSYPSEAFRIKDAAVYIRVSTARDKQPGSMDNQISKLVYYVNKQPTLRLHGIYVDIGSGRSAESRKELRRLLDDCESGDIEGTSGIKLVGPCGEVELEKGVIAAKRHIHMTPEDAEMFGVADKQIVKVKIENDTRTTIFGDVVVRVSPKFALAMHIDTDESNAACAFGTCYGKLLKR